MASLTDEDLEKIREDNDKLRSKIADAESQRAEREADAAREIQYAQLQVENIRLQADLVNVKELAKVGTVKAGVAILQESVKEELKTAIAVAEAPVGAVDTNAENPPKNTTGATVAESEDKSGGNS